MNESIEDSDSSTGTFNDFHGPSDKNADILSSSQKQE
jgi:hypothetical protein